VLERGRSSDVNSSPGSTGKMSPETEREREMEREMERWNVSSVHTERPYSAATTNLLPKCAFTSVSHELTV